MLKLRWWMLAVLAGGLAGFYTWIALDGPDWKQACVEPADDVFFNGDGSVLTSAHELLPISGQPLRPRLVRWDVETGRKLDEVVVQSDETNPASRLIVKPIPGDEKVLVQSPGPQHEIFNYGVYNAKTGEKLAGPMYGRHWVHRISVDGRWFESPQESNGLAINAVETGDTILRLKENDTAYPWNAVFSPNGSQVAVYWRPQNKDGSHEIQLYDLPTTQEGKRLKLPARTWSRLNNWESDNRLYAEINEPDGNGPGHYHRRSFSFDMSETNFGVERSELLRYGHVNGTELGQTIWDSGPGWVAQVKCFGTIKNFRTGPEQVMDWIDSKAGTQWAPAHQNRCHAQFFDAVSGQATYTLPHLTYPFIISKDGRRVAGAGKVIQIWRIPPTRNWLWIGAISALAACCVLAVGRWRTIAMKKGARKGR